MYLLHQLSVQQSLFLCPIIKSHDRNMDGCSVQYPVAVTPSHEDVAALKNPLQDGAIHPTANALGCKQSSALTPPRFNLQMGFFKPVANQVCEAWYAIVVNLEKLLNIPISEFLPNSISPKERRIADDEIRLWP